jgi:hypothetical protein
LSMVPANSCYSEIRNHIYSFAIADVKALNAETPARPPGG